MKVSFSSPFKRAFKKRIKGKAELEARFWQKLEQFTVDPFDPSLKTHKLSGAWNLFIGGCYERANSAFTRELSGVPSLWE